jgi:hypothetical protein
MWPGIKSRTLIRFFFCGYSTVRIVAFSQDGGCLMEVDEEKVDDMILALLYLTTFGDKSRLRAWKGHNWDALDRLHRKDFISDPATKAKSVVLTDAGAKRSQELFEKYFAK